MKSNNYVRNAIRLSLLAASLLGLYGCAHQPVVAKCPELPVPPPQLTAPVQPKNYLCELAKILAQPSLCTPSPVSETTTPQ